MCYFDKVIGLVPINIKKPLDQKQSNGFSKKGILQNNV